MIKLLDSALNIVGPEVTQFLKLMQFEELSIVLDTLDLLSQKAVYFSLNNNHDPSSAGGSHWSLLIFCNRSQCFYHLDSSSSKNTSLSRDQPDKCFVEVEESHFKMFN